MKGKTDMDTITKSLSKKVDLIDHDFKHGNLTGERLQEADNICTIWTLAMLIRKIPEDKEFTANFEQMVDFYIDKYNLKEEKE